MVDPCREVASVTARVTTLKGPGAGEYYVKALPSYYLNTGEPKGIWHGRGAAELGLDGEVVDGEFLKLMAGNHPRMRGDVLLGRVYGEDSVRGFDITASAPKSVSTMFAIGDDSTRSEVLEAHDTAVATMLEWVETHAHTRYRIGGQVAVVDAEGIVAATFRQHTSRSLDPQLHTHVVIANRVRSDDGRWLALDARAMKLDQRTLSGVYHLTLRSELTARLGVDWQPVVNGIAEIGSIPDVVLEEFSTRTAGVQRRIDEKIDRFIDNLERDPTPRERWRLEREAVVDSRPPKSKDVDSTSLHAGWRRQVENLGLQPHQVIDQAVEWVSPKPIDNDIYRAACTQAIEVLSENQSTWRPAELTREIAAALPTDIGIDASAMVELLDAMTAHTMEQHCVDISRPAGDGVRLRRDGRPVTESVIDRALTTPEILAQEQRLLAWAERRMAHDPTEAPEAGHRSPVELTGPQAEAAASIAGDADLVLVVGPAGTGKTTALTPAVAQLQALGRAVFGVAPSAAAADVLSTETGVAADTIDKLLYEHSLKRPPDHRYNLPTGATVIVDEAGMAPTNKLDQLCALADNQGWRVALVGDPMQFSAVGRGGMFEHLIDTHGAIELDQVHRFSNEWERHASLRLRRGDPAIADIYDLQGRLHGGTTTRMEHQALDAWKTARANNETVLLLAPGNDTVTRLNQQAQQRRIAAGEIDANSRSVNTGGCRLHVGDEVVTRRNHRLLHTNQGLPIRNRDQWTINTVHRDGALTVNGQSGTVKLPADYVAEHVQLGYAQTSHAAQGRTVDRSILLLDGSTDSRGIYVPMTRGRHHNDAYIVTNGETTATEVFTNSIANNWIDRPAVARQTELDTPSPDIDMGHRPGTLPGHQLRQLFDQRAALTETLTQLDHDLKHLSNDYNRTLQQRKQPDAQATKLTAELSTARQVLADHDRPLRRRGHETDIAKARRIVEQHPGHIESARAEHAQLTERLSDLDRKLTGAEKLDERRPQLGTQLDDIDRRLLDDRRNRSRGAAIEQPSNVIDTIGARPANAKTRQAWDIAAGTLNQHQTAYGDAMGTGKHEPTGISHSSGLLSTAVAVLRKAIQHEHHIANKHEGPALTRGR
ncbi:MAG: conjugative relaxase-like TrwC/TraI family protein [Verrucomicrobiales bacterium]|jgi:conjugative relaxase-like TrwC/TraI family protein